MLVKCSVPLVTSRIWAVYLITALSLPPNSVVITSNALLLARLKSWGCVREMFLQESYSAVPVALVVSMEMRVDPRTVKFVRKLCIAEKRLTRACEQGDGELKYTGVMVHFY